jgi:hypothetical protein
MADRIDHIALGNSRVAKQFQESPKFLAFLAAMLAFTQEVEDCLQSMYYLTDVDTMTGANLDVIGRIVGTSRFVTTVINLTYFGFDDTGAYATRFGEEGQPDIGSRFYEEGEVLASTTILADPEFRMLIRAKIVKNSSQATNEDIIRGLQYLFDTLDIHIVDNLNMSISIKVGRPLYALEQALLTTLDIIPRPAGVRVADISSYVPVPIDYVGGLPPYGEP